MLLYLGFLIQLEFLLILLLIIINIDLSLKPLLNFQFIIKFGSFHNLYNRNFSIFDFLFYISPH